jgi:hypothetical protein
MTQIISFMSIVLGVPWIAFGQGVPADHTVDTRDGGIDPLEAVVIIIIINMLMPVRYWRGGPDPPGTLLRYWGGVFGCDMPPPPPKKQTTELPSQIYQYYPLVRCILY